MVSVLINSNFFAWISTGSISYITVDKFDEGARWKIKKKNGFNVANQQFYLEKITPTYCINNKGEWVVGQLVATLGTIFFPLLNTVANWKPLQETDNEI